MTDAQKDAIIKAAQQVVRVWIPGERPGFVASVDGLATALRAAEQRWTVGDAGILGPALECDGKWAWTCMNAQHPASRALVERIARLLNADDAKGGK